MELGGGSGTKSLRYSADDEEDFDNCNTTNCVLIKHAVDIQDSL